MTLPVIAIGYDTSYVTYSNNGSDWTTYTLGSDYRTLSIAMSDDIICLIVKVGAGGDALVLSSVNGIDWTIAYNFGAYNTASYEGTKPICVSYANNQFILSVYDFADGDTYKILTSTNLTAWTLKWSASGSGDVPVNVPAGKIAHIDGVYVQIGEWYYYDILTARRSANLETWTSLPNLFDVGESRTAGIHSDGTSIFVTGKFNYFAKTTDGVNWTVSEVIGCGPGLYKKYGILFYEDVGWANFSATDGPPFGEVQMTSGSFATRDCIAYNSKYIFCGNNGVFVTEDFVSFDNPIIASAGNWFFLAAPLTDPVIQDRWRNYRRSAERTE